jgi:hypothetical protein
VIHPVRKLNSFQPQASKAQVKAQYAPATPVCCAVWARPTKAPRQSAEEMTKLRVTAVRDMRFKRITIPVLNHQIKIANPNATKVSVILGFQCL